MESSLGPTWSTLVKVFHVNIGVIAMCFMLVLFYFISLEIARNFNNWNL